MVQGYQERDKKFIDYNLFKIDDFYCRGPKPDLNKPYICCIGGASTFGCYCEDPYPKILGDYLKLEILNLGFAGVGPKYFLKPRFLKLINNAEFVIIQTMSGRSASNSKFDCVGENSGFNHYANTETTPYVFWEEALKRNEAKELILETRVNYLTNTEELLKEIVPPKILLWFSRRSNKYKFDDSNVFAMWNDYPQLVDTNTIDSLKLLVDDYIECTTARGSPQVLDNNTLNTYYPSPEMHVDAFLALKKSRLLRKTILL